MTELLPIRFLFATLLLSAAACQEEPTGTTSQGHVADSSEGPSPDATDAGRPVSAADASGSIIMPELLTCPPSPCEHYSRLQQEYGGQTNASDVSVVGSDKLFSCESNLACNPCQMACVNGHRTGPDCQGGLICDVEGWVQEFSSCMGSCLVAHSLENCSTSVLSPSLCDGFADCPGAEDEQDVACVIPDPAFQCRDGMIPRSLVCDGTVDCEYGEDEPCPQSYECVACVCPSEGSSLRLRCPPDIECTSGERVTINVERERLLDGTNDCPLGDDEHVAEALACGTRNREEWCQQLLAAETGYLCQDSGLRIPRSAVCNGISDCPLGDDEPCSSRVQECPEQNELVARYLEARGAFDVMTVAEQFSVDRGCVDTGNPDDCPFVCDEQGCLFPCANGQFIDQVHVADGLPNCPGGEDEPCAREVSCAGPLRSLPFNRVCDGVVDCDGGSDETDCPRVPEHFVCADGMQIVFPGLSCGAALCADWSDYEACPTRVE